MFGILLLIGMMIMSNKDKNVLVLAYLGDSVYEIYVREFLVQKGIAKVKDLQASAVCYVSARAQSKFLHMMMEKQFLTDEELEIVYRARNHRGSSHPKNTDIVTYKYATGLEALVGFLYLENRVERIQEIMNFILRSE